MKRDPHGEVSAPIEIAAIAPGLFTAASITQVRADGPQIIEPVSATPIRLGNSGEEVFLNLFGTGIRGHSGAVTVHVGDRSAPALVAGAQPGFAGLDEVDVRLTTDLVRSGSVAVSVEADGVASNSVALTFE